MAMGDWDPNEEPIVKRNLALQIASVLHAVAAIALATALPQNSPYPLLLFYLWPLWLYPLVRYRDGSWRGVVVAIVMSMIVLAPLLLSLIFLIAFLLGGGHPHM
jgi:hypothetical protein